MRYELTDPECESAPKRDPCWARRNALKSNADRRRAGPRHPGIFAWSFISLNEYRPAVNRAACLRRSGAYRPQ
jgi:hypothetical protein